MNTFVGYARQHDDITALVLRVIAVRISRNSAYVVDVPRINPNLPSCSPFPHNRVMSSRPFADQIGSRLRAEGYQAYLVGGCVRDILLDREPADYDVATDATPDRVEEMFPNSLTVGARLASW